MPSARNLLDVNLARVDIFVRITSFRCAHHVELTTSSTCSIFKNCYACDVPLTMGLGIFEDWKLEHVPGTARVLDDERRREEEQAVARRRGLKYDASGKILLVPQPSDDPNDPLVCSPFHVPLNIPLSAMQMICRMRMAIEHS